MKVYVTTMLRWGDLESHHYLVGVYSTPVQAKFAGEVERSWRGGKYEFVVEESEVDAPVTQDQLKYHYSGVT